MNLFVKDTNEIIWEWFVVFRTGVPELVHSTSDPTRTVQWTITQNEFHLTLTGTNKAGESYTCDESFKLGKWKSKVEDTLGKRDWFTGESSEESSSEVGLKEEERLEIGRRN